MMACSCGDGSPPKDVINSISFSRMALNRDVLSSSSTVQHGLIGEPCLTAFPIAWGPLRAGFPYQLFRRGVGHSVDTISCSISLLLFMNFYDSGW